MKMNNLLVKVGYSAMVFQGLSAMEIGQLSALLGKASATDDKWDGSNHVQVLLPNTRVKAELVPDSGLFSEEEYNVMMKAKRDAEEKAKEAESED